MMYIFLIAFALVGQTAIEKARLAIATAYVSVAGTISYQQA